MTSVDELFKKPSLPSGSTKRKFDAPDAQEVYKAAKLSANGSPNGRNRANGATVEDAGGDEDIEAGPELPPDDEDDDEEGRFFGGGVTRDAAEALDYIDEQDEDGFAEEKIDSAWLRRLAVSFEKKANKNAGLRARYEGDPQKFMASEADLDAEIKSWSLLSEHPELYMEFAQGESVAMVVGLLAHENTDIAIGAIEIVSELLDEDVEAEQEQWDALVTALLDADLLDLLMSNLARLDEENESDRSGVYHSLAVLENLGSQQAIAEKIGQERVLMWLCERISKPEKPVGQNKQYAAEVLQVLLQSSPLLRKRLALDIDGMDLFLRLLSSYRKRDPEKDSQEEEFAENVFDCLTCVVDEVEGKSKFVDAEGVELCLIMLKEATFSKVRALRLLDHAVAGQGLTSIDVCQKLVEAGGLKTTFSMFMKKADSATIEHLLGIFSALLRLLPGDSPARIRTLAKFSEKDFEKLAKLTDLRKDYARKVASVNEGIELERRMLDEDEQAERADEFFSRRLDGGLFCLQTIDIVLAWLAAEDPFAKARISSRLGSFDSVKTSLQEQFDLLDPKAADDEDTRDMLSTLISFLD
jgi:beta-catenin-like protein 1